MINHSKRSGFFIFENRRKIMRDIYDIQIFYKGKEIGNIELFYVTPEEFFIRYFDEKDETTKTLRCGLHDIQYK